MLFSNTIEMYRRILRAKNVKAHLGNGQILHKFPSHDYLQKGQPCSGRKFIPHLLPCGLNAKGDCDKTNHEKEA